MSVYNDNLVIRNIGRDAWIFLGSSRKLQIILAPSNRGNGFYFSPGFTESERVYLRQKGQEIREYLWNYITDAPTGVEFLIGDYVHEPAAATTPSTSPQVPAAPPDIIPIHVPTTPVTPNDKIYYV